MTPKWAGWNVAVLVALGGCMPAAGGEDLLRLAPAGSLLHPSGGFFEHERSPLVPYCHGVLIAPDVVVTSAVCADEGAWELSFGVGAVGSGTIAVERAVLHPDSADPRHGLVALLLERPVEGIEPAVLVAPEETPCDVEVPSYQVVTRGDSSARTTWTACGHAPTEDDPEEYFVAVMGTPNCHGDSGAGAFLAGTDEDQVFGWVTGAGHRGGPHPISDVCVTDVELATVADNRDFLDAALAMSRAL